MEKEAFFEIFSSGDFLRITPIEKESENWIKSLIEVKTGPFTGKFSASIRMDDFNYLKNSLKNLYTNLKGEARFEDIESHIQIKIAGDAIGHFTAQCTVVDIQSYGRSLSFNLIFDQTQLLPMVRQLEAITHPKSK